MPRYYFHIYENGRLIVPDAEGLELPHVEAARAECSAIIREVLQEEMWSEAFANGRELRICDGMRQTLFVVPFPSLPLETPERDGNR